MILRALGRHWWRILGLWLVVSAPIASLIYLYVKPTYLVSSLLRIEPAQKDVFGPLTRDDGEFKSQTFLKTQVTMITSDKVLNPAVADQNVASLPSIFRSDDPKSDLRKNLVVEILEDTNLIRVGLELSNPEEAVTIVSAVVQSFLTQNKEFSRGANQEQTDLLTQQLKKLEHDIDEKKGLLKDLVTKGKVAVLKPEEYISSKSDADGSQPTLKKVTENQLQQMISEMVRTDLELFEVQSKLEVRLGGADANGTDGDKANIDEEQLQERIQAEFSKDPEVQELIGELKEKIEYLDHANELARQANDPSRIAARKEVAKLQKQYNALWAQRYTELKDRLLGLGGTSGLTAGGTSESIADLKLKVAALNKRKEKQTAQLKVMQVEQKETNDDTFEATYLTHQVSSLMELEDQLKKNLAQLKFEANQDRYRVALIDPAAAPKICV